MSVPSVSLFIIISALYATSVPLYLKTWPKWLRVLSLALASTTLTLFYLEPLRKTSPNSQKAQNLLARVITCSFQSCSPRTVLQQLHWLPIKHRIDFKIANVTFRTLHFSQPAYLRSSLHACHSTRSFRSSNTNLSAPFVHIIWLLQLRHRSPWNLELSPSISPYLYQSWHLLSSPHDPLLPAGLPIHLTPLLLRLRFGYADHCARLLIIFTYYWFTTLHFSQPAYLRSSLHACHSTGSFRPSNTNLLSAPFVRTSFGSRCFSIAAPKIWNSLPLSFRTCTSPDTFCHHLETHFTASRPSNPLSPSPLAPHRFGFADHCARL